LFRFLQTPNKLPPPKEKKKRMIMIIMMMKPWQAPLNKAPGQGGKEEQRERSKVMGCNL
jgi:hypothetical protein